MGQICPPCTPPPITVWDQVYFLPWTLYFEKNGCQPQNIGMDYLLAAIFKMAAWTDGEFTISLVTLLLRQIETRFWCPHVGFKAPAIQWNKQNCTIPFPSWLNPKLCAFVLRHFPFWAFINVIFVMGCDMGTKSSHTNVHCRENCLNFNLVARLR